MENFRNFKKEILEKRLRYPYDLKDKVLLERCENFGQITIVIKRDFLYFCGIGVLNEDLFSKYGKTLNKYNIFYNEDVYNGFLLAVKNKKKNLAYGDTLVYSLDANVQGKCGSTIYAHGASQIEAEDRVLIHAYDHSKTKIKNHCILYACGDTENSINDNSIAYVSGNSKTYSTSSICYASQNAYIKGYLDSFVMIKGNAIAEVFSNSILKK